MLEYSTEKGVKPLEINDVLDARKIALEEALKRQMIKTPYNRITVNQLIEEVGISRKTFYRTFSSKDECLDSLIEQFVLNQHRRVTLTLTEPVDLMAAYKTVLLYWKENKPFADALIRDDLLFLFLNASTTHVMKEEQNLYRILQTSDTACDEDIILFFNAGNTVLAIHWLQNGCKTPVDEMAHKLVRLNHTQLIVKDPG